MQDLITNERRRFADWLEGLPAARWDAATLCDAWRVRDVVGHLTFTWRVPTWRLLTQMARHRGFHGASRVGAMQLAEIGPVALIKSIRDHADDPATPPGAYEGDLLAEITIHPLDIAIPNGLDWTVEKEALPPLLDFLTTSKKAPAYHRSGGIRGVRWVATDIDWSWGTGPEVSGTGQDLALAIANRPAAVIRLNGDGVEALA